MCIGSIDVLYNCQFAHSHGQLNCLNYSVLERKEEIYRFLV